MYSYPQHAHGVTFYKDVVRFIVLNFKLMLFQILF